MMKEDDKYLKAKKKVAQQKNFYNHLQVFVIVVLVVFIFSDAIFDFFEAHIENNRTLKWVKMNLWVNVLLWAAGVLIHAIFTFKNKIDFIDKWEKRKVKEFMNETK